MSPMQSFSLLALSGAAICLATVACSSQDAAVVEVPPVVWQTSIRIHVVTEAGAPVADAPITLTLFTPTGLLLAERFEGNRTDQTGAYSKVVMAPHEGMAPIIIDVAPPAGSGLDGVHVRDSTRFMPPPAVTTVITVTLPQSS